MLSPPSFAITRRIAQVGDVEERSGQEQTKHNRMQQHNGDGLHTTPTEWCPVTPPHAEESHLPRNALPG
jgi:hypothetical protein